MLKNIVFYLISLIFIFSFVACGGGGDATQPEGNDAAQLDNTQHTFISDVWLVETIDPSPQVQWNNGMKITLNKNGYPHIVYGEKTIEYVYFDESGWHKKQIDAFTNYGSALPAIAVDGKDKAHIVYRNHEDSKFIYTTNASGDWNYTTFDFDASSAAIAVDSKNTPHIFANLSTDLNSYYMTNASGEWSKKLIGGRGEYLKIAIDSSDKIHLSYVYYAPYNNGIIKYATNKNGPWFIGSVSNEGYYNSLKIWQFYIDQNQACHIAYKITYRVNQLPGSCYGDCFFTDLKHATNSSGFWKVANIATTNHLDSAQNTVPAGSSQYLGVLDPDLPPQYSYLYGKDALSYVIFSDGLISTAEVDQDISIPTDWFDCVQGLSGILHVFYFDQVSNSFKYATNSYVK